MAKDRYMPGSRQSKITQEMYETEKVTGVPPAVGIAECIRASGSTFVGLRLNGSSILAVYKTPGKKRGVTCGKITELVEFEPGEDISFIPEELHGLVHKLWGASV